jgi:DNA-directed RNA polymerase specialized sigma subunit
MKEVGSALGIGESRVSQIHSTALLRLREQLADAMASAASGGNS